MKKLILVLALVLSFAQNSFAVPRGFYIAKPKSIRVDKKKMELVLKIDLKCEEYNEEWFDHVITGSDDEGDYAIAVGLLLSTSNCRESKKKKEFTFRFDLKRISYETPGSLEGVTFEPIMLKEEAE